jgi:transposase
MKAYSVDLRARVADAVLLEGLSWATVARLFRLSVASVGRFVHARRTGQALTPRHPSGRPRRFDSAEKLAAWRAQAQAEFDPETLVFVDESGCNLALSPL